MESDCLIEKILHLIGMRYHIKQQILSKSLGDLKQGLLNLFAENTYTIMKGGKTMSNSNIKRWTGVLIATGAAAVAFVQAIMDAKKEDEMEDLKERVAKLEEK